MLLTTLLVFLSSLVGLGLGQTAQINLIYPPAAATAAAAVSPNRDPRAPARSRSSSSTGRAI